MSEISRPARKKATKAKAAEPEVKRPRGRPSKFTPELAQEICQRIAAGESVRSVARDEHMPTETCIRTWALDDVQGFFLQYTKACQIRAMRWADEIVEIADDGSNDTFIDPNSGQERVNAEVVARSRLRVDTRKWMLSKVLPKVFGDKLDVNHGGQEDNPIKTTTKVVIVPPKASAAVSVKPIDKGGA